MITQRDMAVARAVSEWHCDQNMATKGKGNHLILGAVADKMLRELVAKLGTAGYEDGWQAWDPEAFGNGYKRGNQEATQRALAVVQGLLDIIQEVTYPVDALERALAFIADNQVFTTDNQQEPQA
jgi:hypothetical protein